MLRVSNFLTYKCRVMELNYKIQNYAWGKKGGASKVAVLHSNVNKEFTIDENTPYAELWLGTHVNGLSSLKSGETLDLLLKKNPDFLGDTVREIFGDELPFLFKVLSVNQALSIQAHPAKKHAEELHNERPDIYKDPNHKPELAIALTPFEALCGFRRASEISYFLENVPELNTITNNIVANYNKDDTELVKEAFKLVFQSPKEVISEELEKLLQRFKTLDVKQREEQLSDLIEKLYEHYPGDVGCFVVYFLNYLKLNPFEAIYLEANLPHAYLSGDCIECMACSDNVVRAGLTPKYIDVETLLSMVIYKGGRAEDRIFQPEVEDENCVIFKPPVPDFAIVQITLYPCNCVETYTTRPRNSASTLLVVSGKARSFDRLPGSYQSQDIVLVPGTAIFLPANESLKISDIEDTLLIYQGLANV